MARHDETAPWKCRAGHMLGLVKRNGSGQRKLVLFRMAIHSQPETDDDEVDVLAVVDEMSVLDARCSICGQVRTWVPGRQGVRRMAQILKEYSNEP